MRNLTRLLVVPATIGLLFAGSSMASAGEINGNGQPEGGNGGGTLHANSECSFSGLEDGGDYPGQPAGPGATPQTFGHTVQAAKAGLLGPDITGIADIKAAGFNPGVACNGHLSPRK
jgi:hypothetical protein